MKKFLNLLCVVFLSVFLTGCGGPKDYKTFSSVLFYQKYLEALGKDLDFSSVEMNQKSGINGIQETISTLDSIKSNLDTLSKQKLDKEESDLVNICTNTDLEAKNVYNAELKYVNSFGLNKTELENFKTYSEQFGRSRLSLDSLVNNYKDKNKDYNEKDLKKVKLEYTSKELKTIITTGVNEYALICKIIASQKDNTSLSVISSVVKSYCQYNSYFFERILLSCEKDTPKYRCINSLKTIYDEMSKAINLVIDSTSTGKDNSSEVNSIMKKCGMEITNIKNNFSKI